MENNLEELFFKYRFYLLAVLLGIILILAGFVATTKQLPFFEQDKVEILGTSESGDAGNKGNGGNMVVEISGAVEKPGVYEFETGKRVEDALVAAGGLSAVADREWVDRTLNKAAKLTDGQKIFIPDLTQKSNVKTQNYSSKVKSLTNGNTGDLVDINSASQSELEELPGIGPVTAKKIIDVRPYSTVEELLSRKILSKKVFEENKEKLSIY